MAKATRTTRPARVDEVTLTLTRREALYLLHAVRRTSDSPRSYTISPTKLIVSEIRNALLNAFAGDVEASELSSVNVIGGTTVLRTEAHKYLDPHDPEAIDF